MEMETLTDTEVRDETKRLLDVLAWGLTEEGIEYHTVNKGSQFKYSIAAGMLEDLVNDAIDTNEYCPAYVIGYLALRIWGQHPEHREELEKIFDFNKLDELSWGMNKSKEYLARSSSG